MSQHLAERSNRSVSRSRCHDSESIGSSKSIILLRFFCLLRFKESDNSFFFFFYSSFSRVDADTLRSSYSFFLTWNKCFCGGRLGFRFRPKIPLYFLLFMDETFSFARLRFGRWNFIGAAAKKSRRAFFPCRSASKNYREQCEVAR